MRTKNIFGEECIVVCESLFKETTADILDFLKGNLNLCASSENIFIFWEEILDSAFLNIFKKYAEKIEEFKPLSYRETQNWLKKEAEKKKIALSGDTLSELVHQSGENLWLLSSELEKYALSSKKALEINQKMKQVNVYHITDAISERDRSRAWFLFQKALLSGVDPEEIFWKIVWQIKNLLLLKKLFPMPEKKIAEASGLHPFVIKKTLPALRFYTAEELSKYSLELITLYHNTRRGLIDFDNGIEKFLIKL